MSAGLPIAVTDSRDRLVGVVASEAVLGRLAAEDDAEAPQGPEAVEKRTYA